MVPLQRLRRRSRSVVAGWSRVRPWSDARRTGRRHLFVLFLTVKLRPQVYRVEEFNPSWFNSVARCCNEQKDA